MTFSIFFDNSLKNQLCKVFVPCCLPVCFAVVWYPRDEAGAKQIRLKHEENTELPRIFKATRMRNESEFPGLSNGFHYNTVGVACE
jgi:hypothetical protein